MLPAGCLWQGALSPSLLGGWPCTSLTVMHDGARPTDVKGRRIGAYIIDIVIWFAVVILVAGISDMPDNATTLLNFVVVIVLFGFLPGTTGWTPGKLMLGLRVVHRDTYEVAGIGRNLLRGLLLIIDTFPWFFPIVGLVLMLVDKQGRRLGDRAARTLVIHHSYLGAKPAPAQADATGHAADHGIPAAPGDQADEQAAAHAAPADPAGQAVEPAADDADPARQAVEQAAGDADAAHHAAGQAVEHAAEQADEQPGVGSPHWDTDRGAYIQQHPDTGEWLQWDDDAKIWGPISQA